MPKYRETPKAFYSRAAADARTAHILIVEGDYQSAGELLLKSIENLKIAEEMSEEKA